MTKSQGDYVTVLDLCISDLDRLQDHVHSALIKDQLNKVRELIRLMKDDHCKSNKWRTVGVILEVIGSIPAIVGIILATPCLSLLIPASIGIGIVGSLITMITDVRAHIVGHRMKVQFDESDKQRNDEFAKAGRENYVPPVEHGFTWGNVGKQFVNAGVQ